jgi:hypothetical protein
MKNRMAAWYYADEDFMTSRTKSGLPNREKAILGKAIEARRAFVRDAIISGQTMWEQCACIIVPVNGQSPVDGKLAKEIFVRWLADNCPHISTDKACRWMYAASHVMRLVLEIRSPEQIEIPIWLGCGEKSHFISEVLKMPDSQCSPSLVTFRETFDTFLSDNRAVRDADCWLEGTISTCVCSPGYIKCIGGPPPNPPRGVIQFFSVSLYDPVPLVTQQREK